MRSVKWWHVGFLIPVLVALMIASVVAQTPKDPQGANELVAVLELEGVNADKPETSALSEELRSNILQTGKFRVVDRQQLDAILKEQALQQSVCTTKECAVKVGKVLGVRKMVTGRVTKINDSLWQVSAQMVDVESAETVQSVTVNQRGAFDLVLTEGVRSLAMKLTGSDAKAGAASAAKSSEVSDQAFADWVKSIRERPFSDKDFSTWMNSNTLGAYLQGQNATSGVIPVRIQVSRQGNQDLLRAALAPSPFPRTRWVWRTKTDSKEFEQIEREWSGAGYSLLSKDALGGTIQRSLIVGLWVAKPVVR